MSFLFPSLAIAGGLLALAPIVAHLIARRRRRRVAWAAMDFLLESNRKNRAWVQLSELLLLLARVAAVGLAGLLAAGPLVGGWFSGWMEGGGAVHLVLLDDSYSITQRQGDSTGWRRATDALQRLVEANAGQGGARLVVARYSDPVRGSAPIEESLEGDAAARWRRRAESLLPGETAARPAEGVRRLTELARQAAQEGAPCYAYVLSDFQRVSHELDDPFAPAIEALGAETDGLVLALCDSPDDENLSIDTLTLDPGPLAEGVEATLRLAVTNQSARPAGEVSIRLTRDGQPLPAVTLGPFEPGERLAETLPVLFLGEGVHTVVAEAPPDRVATDNLRRLVVRAPAAQRVLLVDGSRDRREGAAYAAALRPYGGTRTGWFPQRVSDPRPESLGDLTDVAAVLLLDVERLSVQAEGELRRFVESGGGLIVSLGPNADVDYYNERFAGGAGLARWSLDLPTQAPLVEPGLPSLSVGAHPALRLLAGEGSVFLSLARVALRHTVVAAVPPPDGAAQGDAPPQAAEAIASLADGAPLLLEGRLGKGRVVTLLTAAAARDPSGAPWSNLATLPVFPVLVNELVGWVAAERLGPREIEVGRHASRVDGVSLPGALQRLEDDGFENVTTLSEGAEPPIARQGVYRVVAADGGEATPFAANPLPDEGRLAAPDSRRLAELAGPAARVTTIDELFRERPASPNTAAATVAAAALLLMLTGERLLALRCSYLQAPALARKGVA